VTSSCFVNAAIWAFASASWASTEGCVEGAFGGCGGSLGVEKMRGLFDAMGLFEAIVVAAKVLGMVVIGMVVIGMLGVLISATPFDFVGLSKSAGGSYVLEELFKEVRGLFHRLSRGVVPIHNEFSFVGLNLWIKFHP
jgi:hypothetical protein